MVKLKTRWWLDRQAEVCRRVSPKVMVEQRLQVERQQTHGKHKSVRALLKGRVPHHELVKCATELSGAIRLELACDCRSGNVKDTVVVFASPEQQREACERHKAGCVFLMSAKSNRLHANESTVIRKIELAKNGPIAG
jgi:hypothetical protein